MEFIIKKAQNGDKEAFINLINECMPQMYKVAKAKLISDNDVGDAIQDTILAAYKNLTKLKDPRYFKTWITKILINKCNDILSRNKKIIYIDDYNNVSNESDINSYSNEIEENLDFIETLKILNEEYRAVVVLYYANGLTTKQIGEVLSEKEGTIKSRLSRAKKQLKDYYINNNLYDNSFNLNIGGNVK